MLYYKMDVLEALKAAGYNTNRMRTEKIMGQKTLQQMRNGDVIGMIALDKVCEILNLQPGDIIGYKPDAAEEG